MGSQSRRLLKKLQGQLVSTKLAEATRKARCDNSAHVFGEQMARYFHPEKRASTILSSSI